MIYYFVGVLCAVLVTVGLIMDLERKRVRLSRVARRLEEITHGKVRSRVRHVRALTMSMFMYEELLRQLDEQIAMIEQERGLEPGELSGHDWYLLEKRLRGLRRRVERLAEAS